MEIPENIKREIEEARDAIIEHHGQAVYDGIWEGKYRPDQIMRLIRDPDKELWK